MFVEAVLFVIAPACLAGPAGNVLATGQIHTDFALAKSGVGEMFEMLGRHADMKTP